MLILFKIPIFTGAGPGWCIPAGNCLFCDINNTMKNIAIALLASVLMSGNCTPDPPDVPEDLLIQIMTDGEWSVTEYKLNGVDKLTEFAGWRFKYYANKTVDAKYSGSVVTSGTWDGSSSSMTMTALFPAATHPVTLVTGTWQITSPGTRVVAATQTSGTDVKTMKLYRE
jgi:hypothetical protein